MSASTNTAVETHRQDGHILKVVRYFRNSLGEPNGAMVEINGHPAHLILNRHGELDTHPRRNSSGKGWEMIDVWKKQGLVKVILRGYSAAPDDVMLWQGPIPEQLRGSAFTRG